MQLQNSSDSYNLACSESPEGLLIHRLLGSTPRLSDSVRVSHVLLVLLARVAPSERPCIINAGEREGALGALSCLRQMAYSCWKIGKWGGGDRPTRQDLQSVLRILEALLGRSLGHHTSSFRISQQPWTLSPPLSRTEFSQCPFSSMSCQNFSQRTKESWVSTLSKKGGSHPVGG